VANGPNIFQMLLVLKYYATQIRFSDLTYCSDEHSEAVFIRKTCTKAQTPLLRFSVDYSNVVYNKLATNPQQIEPVESEPYCALHIAHCRIRCG